MDALDAGASPAQDTADQVVMRAGFDGCIVIAIAGDRYQCSVAARPNLAGDAVVDLHEEIVELLKANGISVPSSNAPTLAQFQGALDDIMGKPPESTP